MAQSRAFLCQVVGMDAARGRIWFQVAAKPQQWPLALCAGRESKGLQRAMGSESESFPPSGPLRGWPARLIWNGFGVTPWCILTPHQVALKNIFVPNRMWVKLKHDSALASIVGHLAEGWGCSWWEMFVLSHQKCLQGQRGMSGAVGGGGHPRKRDKLSLWPEFHRTATAQGHVTSTPALAGPTGNFGILQESGTHRHKHTHSHTRTPWGGCILWRDSFAVSTWQVLNLKISRSAGLELGGVMGRKHLPQHISLVTTGLGDKAQAS